MTQAGNFVVTISKMAVLLEESSALAGRGQDNTILKKSASLTRAQYKKNTYVVHWEEISFYLIEVDRGIHSPPLLNSFLLAP